MKITQFLGHHGLKDNPFGQEDAQSDLVFKQHCLNSTHHPAWDKIIGSPSEPSTAVVFGEKGAGKTALRLQIAQHIRNYNRGSPQQRAFVIEYDDFNPFLDAFRERLLGWQRGPDRALTHWRLWDHMDSILTLGVTRLTNVILGDPPGQATIEGQEITRAQLEDLTHLQRRDLLLLAAFYDKSTSLSHTQRWSALRSKLGFSTWRSYLDGAWGVVVSLTFAIIWLSMTFESLQSRFGVFTKWWFWALMLVGWGPWLWRQLRLLWVSMQIARQIRVIEHPPQTLRQILAQFDTASLSGQPLPSRDRSDDRYELLNKLRSVLQTLGFPGVVVIVDRVDEPHLINGNAERMKSLLWPMFDNKFLKQPGWGFKLLLPREVYPFVNREDKEFYERSRLDKQNLIPSLEWTGESLYDLANSRLEACSSLPGAKPTLKEWFDDSLGMNELISNLARLRVPRHLFKFLYRLLMTHCNKFSQAEPRWKIDRETLLSELALYQRDLDALDRGLGAG